MHYQDVYSLDEAARRLGLAPRRLARLLGAGIVNGERLGRGWLVPASEVERPLPPLPGVGRPFASRLAWSILASLEGREAPATLAREERARLRRYLARPLSELAPRLRGRAERRPLIVGRETLAAIGASGRWLVGGARALRLVAAERAPEVDLYLPAGRYEELLDESLGVPDPGYGNLVAHLVDEEVWPFEGAAKSGSVWDCVAILDLFDAGSLDAPSLDALRARLLTSLT